MAHSADHPPGDGSLLWSFIVSKRRVILRGVLMMVIVGAVGVSILILLEMAQAPWARSLGMWSTLAGDWTGELETKDGLAQPVFFAIWGYVPKRGRPLIEGRARLCDRSGSIRDYEISGRPDNWRGTRFHVSMASEHDSRLGPGELRGEWQGDAIRAIGILVSHGPVVTAEVSRSSGPEAPPQVHYTLRRGSETDFLAACQRLTRRNEDN